MIRPRRLWLTALMIPLFTGCGSDPVQQAYDDCMAQVGEAKVEAGDDAMKGLVEGVQKMAESACGMVLTTCESNREGAMCQGMISRYTEGG